MSSSDIILSGKSNASADHADAVSQALAGCLRGERESQRQLYELFEQRCYRLILGFVPASDAADVLQCVFIRVFQKLSQFQGESSFDSWLYRLTVNECLQALRSQRRRRQSALDYEPMDTVPSHERIADQREILELGLARLDEQLRTIYVLREIQQLSYAEIALTLRINEGTVASRLSRARQELKQILIDLGWEP
ncbi:MAG: RNA polymerase sigma factor [Pirellulales bacterium]|nr:RNA polymerase sigma factor [Pirellulales bacterium]